MKNNRPLCFGNIYYKYVNVKIVHNQAKGNDNHKKSVITKEGYKSKKICGSDE